MPITYHLGNDLNVSAVVDVYRSSTLQSRPLGDPDAMRQMLAAADIVVSAWEGETLLGIARSLSDFVFCTYLSDLAVRLEYQRQGIGRELVRRTQKAGKGATVFLFAAPAAVGYYERLGFTAGSGWLLTPLQRLK
ncbi:MAG TPA: GNAT family N-acetyltransferase [Polyangiaceae bacterium]|nr:GNAT family N-acetyltransferase [Polyangiaceae bacterium]